MASSLRGREELGAGIRERGAFERIRWKLVRRGRRPDGDMLVAYVPETQGKIKAMASNAPDSNT